MSNVSTIARNSMWNVLDTGLGIIASLFCSVAVARVMGPQKLGYYNYVLWIASMTGLVVSLGIPAATQKFAAEYLGRGDGATAHAIVRATYRFQAVMALVTGLVGLIVVWATVAPERRVWASIAILSLVPQLLYAIPAAALAATEDLRPNVRTSVVSTSANLLGVGLSLLCGWDLLGITASLMVSRVLDFALRHHFYRRAFAQFEATPVKLPPALRKHIVRYCWQSTALLALDVIVWDRSEMFFLERFSDIREVAFYSLSFNIVQNLFVLPRVLAWSADTTMLVQQGRAPHTMGALGVTTMRYMALFSIPLSFGLAALADPALRFVYSNRYAPAIPVLGALALLSVGKALQLPAQRLLMAADKQGFLLGWGACMAVFNIAADLWLIPSRGAMGAALAKGAVQTVAMIGVWIYVSRVFKAQVPVGRLLALLVASGIMYGAVRVVELVPSSAAALVIGVPFGAALFLVLLRLSGFLGTADQKRLLSLQRMLPGRLRRPFQALVMFVAPGSPPPVVPA